MSDLGDFTEFDPDEGTDDDDGPGDGDATTAGGDTGTDASTADPATDESGGFESVGVRPQGADSGLGVVSATEGLRISEDGDETQLRAYVTVANRSSVRIGTYLLVPYPDGGATATSPGRVGGHAGGERLFCRITALEYAQEFRADD
ncbi:MAG: hypothetical protein V5A28_10580, partial [Haloarculaceae archaeon]